jgi:hypothetical protein
MKALRKTVVIATAIGLLGVAGIAAAEIKNSHTMTVTLPDGSVEQIRYTGDRPPQVSMRAGPGLLNIFAVADPSVAADPFVDIERISTAMNREADAMFQDIGRFPDPAFGAPDGLTAADLSKLPPGVEGYSMVSTLSGNDVCTRTVQYRSNGDGEAPTVRTQVSSGCGGAPTRTGPGSPPHADQSSSLIQAGYKQTGHKGAPADGSDL